MPKIEIVFSVRELPSGGYEARAVGHSIFIQADVMDELEKNALEAVRCHFSDDQSYRITLVLTPKNRLLGSAKGEFTVPDDFNDPLPKEIEDLFYREE